MVHRLTAEQAAASLIQRIADEADDFIVLPSYEDFQLFLKSGADELFDHESLMRVRTTGVLGYYKGKTVVVLPNNAELEISFRDSEIDV